MLTLALAVNTSLPLQRCFPPTGGLQHWYYAIIPTLPLRSRISWSVTGFLGGCHRGLFGAAMMPVNDNRLCSSWVMSEHRERTRGVSVIDILTEPVDQRIRWLASITAVVAIGPLSVVGVAVTAPSWWEGVSAATGYVLALGVLREWSLDRYPRRAMFAVTFTAVMWVIGALTLTSPISFVPLSLTGVMLLARTRACRGGWLLVFAAGVSGIGSCAVVFHPASVHLVFWWMIMPAVGTMFIAGVILLSENIWLLVRRLECARYTEAELAVARERVRFTGDLHDIHGHTLHVIKLKATLAEHVLHTDPDRSTTELAEICSLVDDTIAQTRALVYAHHDLNLRAELENVGALCEAAGITVHAHMHGDGAAAHPLLAQALRESATNLLRHAHPSVVTIAATQTTLTVTNDGVNDLSRPERGLARLRERFHDAGGQLTVCREKSTFTVQAQIEVASFDRQQEATR